MPWSELSFARRLSLFGFLPATILVVVSGVIQIICLVFALLSQSAFTDQLLAYPILVSQVGLTFGFVALTSLNLASWTVSHWLDFPRFVRRLLFSKMKFRGSRFREIGPLTLKHKMSLYAFWPSSLLVIFSGVIAIVDSFWRVPSAKSHFGLNLGFVILTTLSFLAWNTNHWRDWPQKKRNVPLLLMTRRFKITTPGLYPATILVWLSGAVDLTIIGSDIFFASKFPWNRSLLLDLSQIGLTIGFMHLSLVSLLEWMKTHWSDFPSWIRLAAITLLTGKVASRG